jgi:Mor family transcriptional regulator
MTPMSREMVEVVARAGAGRALAIRAVRALLREFGGQLIYFPSAREHSKQVERLRAVLEEEIGGGAEKVVDAWSRFYGGAQLYLPLEHKAFRDEIADEIYRRYDGKADTMNALCKEYRTSYVQIYRLFHHGQERKTQPSLFL